MQFADRMISNFDALVSRFEPDPSTLTEVIRIAASSTPAEYLVPALVAEFTREHTDISVEVQVTDSAQVARTLADRQAGLGISVMPPTSVGYSSIAMSRDEVVLAVSSDHAFSAQRSISIEQLRVENIVEREVESGTCPTVVQSLSATGIDLPEHRVSMTLGSTQAVAATVEKNLAIGFATKYAVGHHSTDVTAVRIEGLVLERDLKLFYETGRVRGRHTQAFIDFIYSRTNQ